MSKVKSLFRSRRFWASAVGLAAIVSSEVFGYEMNVEQVVGVVSIVIAWVVGDTLRETK